LLGLGVVDVLRRLSGSSDPTLQKYVQRVLTKLQQQPAGGQHPR
jgi:hypothetical protein